MTDLQDPRAIFGKGVLFVFSGSLAAAILLIQHPSWQTAVLLILTVWCFARSYYCAFYVIERYVDRSYRFSGLYSFLVYAIHRRFGWSDEHWRGRPE